MGLPADAAAAPASSAATSGVVDPMGAVAPGFLEASPGAATEEAAERVAVGSAEHTLIARGTATYRSDVGAPSRCLYNGTAAGARVTVVNIDNGRSIECQTAPRFDDGAPADELVLSTEMFLQLADPTDAPVNIEIHQ